MDVDGVVASVASVQEELTAGLLVSSVVGVLLDGYGVQLAILRPVGVVVPLVEDGDEYLREDAEFPLGANEENVGELRDRCPLGVRLVA